MADSLEQRYGHYRLIRFLGEGSFSEVYLGEHIYLNRPVAIKVLQTQLLNEDRQGFFKEARIIASLTHPHIVEVLDCGIEKRTPFLVMKYAPNGTLHERHPEGVPLPPSVILPYVKQVADALQYAHDHNLIHRDVKPRNMLLGPHNEVWLSDFGLALLSHSTISLSTYVPAGTPAYMAPEQFRGKPYRASDQYALAVVVYAWLCGVRPFYGSYQELEYQHNNVPPPSLREKVPEIPPAVEEVVLIALAKDPHGRFRSMRAFANALEQACKTELYLLPPSTFDLPLPPSHVGPLSPGQVALDTAASFDSIAPTIPASETFPFSAQEEPASSILNPLATPVEGVTLPAKPFPSPPGSLPVSESPVPAQQPAWFNRNIPRRGVIGGMIAAAAVASIGGASALFWLYEHGGLSDARTNSHTTTGAFTPASKPTSPATPTARPTSSVTPTSIGSLLYEYRDQGEIKSARWSPDGKYIVFSPGKTAMVKVWNASEGEDIQVVYTHHTDIIKSVAWSPDGKYIASGGQDKTVRVWNAMTGTDLLPGPYTGHVKTVRGVAWSPNVQEQLIASGSEDFTVRIWDATTGTDRFPPYRGHSGLVITVAWSLDGKYIASASFDGTVQVWDPVTGQDILPHLVHSSGVRAVAWSPDGKFIASGGDDRSVHLWDAKTGKLIHTYTAHLGDSVQSVAWSPDEKYIAAGSFDRKVYIWSVATGQVFYIYSHHSNQVWSVAWSPNGHMIASASTDQTMQVWQAP